MLHGAVTHTALSYCHDFTDLLCLYCYRFSINIVYVYNEAGECNGSQQLPTVRLSTRLGGVNATVVPVTKYTRWVPVSGQYARCLEYRYVSLYVIS